MLRVKTQKYISACMVQDPNLFRHPRFSG